MTVTYVSTKPHVLNILGDTNNLYTKVSNIPAATVNIRQQMREHLGNINNLSTKVQNIYEKLEKKKLGLGEYRVEFLNTR